MNLPSPYKTRPLQTELWRRRFGAEAYSVCELVLSELCDAFLFDQDSRHRFLPDDRLAAIYEACHPRRKFWVWGDSMELETLAQNLKKRFGIELSKEHSEITLGDIVEMALEHQTGSE